MEIVEKKEEKDVFYVEVREPNEVRRNILESLKDIVESLKRFEKFKEVGKEKIHSVNKLRRDIKELNKLVSNLKNALPESKLREIKIKPILSKGKKSKKIKNKKEEVEVMKPKTELEKLESELGAIEEKLQGLQ
jgi:phenylalanyl-tRNA synthetase beta subunit